MIRMVLLILCALFVGSAMGSCHLNGRYFKDTFVHRYDCTVMKLGVCTRCEERTNPAFIRMLCGVILGTLLLIFVICCCCCPMCWAKPTHVSHDEEVKVALLTPATAAGYQI